MSERVRVALRDGAQVREFLCPGCGVWGDIDDDQYHGRVSIWHDTPECGYHETKDWSKEVDQ